MTDHYAAAAVAWLGRAKRRPRPPCPVCWKPSIYEMDRYFHMDGSANASCWLTILRGEL